MFLKSFLIGNIEKTPVISGRDLQIGQGVLYFVTAFHKISWPTVW